MPVSEIAVQFCQILGGRPRGAVGVAALVHPPILLQAVLTLAALLMVHHTTALQQLNDRQSRFVADLTHELKTPLTVILTNAELLQAPGYDAPARSRFAGSILTMSQQMRGLVESLLELARVDAGRAQDAQTELDLSALVNDALLPFEPVLFEAGHTLTARVEDGIRVRGNAAQLRQVVEILLDNARHSVTVNGTHIDLTYKEYSLLRLLLENTNLVVTRETILQVVWGTDISVESRTVDMHIRTLRKKLGDAGKYICTVRKVGYKLTDEEEAGEE